MNFKPPFRSGFVPDLSRAKSEIQALNRLLEEEFEILMNQNFDELERLQGAKLELLQSLSVTAHYIDKLSEVPDYWLLIKKDMEFCREAHYRNEKIAVQQLMLIKDALKNFHHPHP